MRNLGDTRDEPNTTASSFGWKLYSAAWVRDVKGKDNLMKKLRTAAINLNPLECVKKTPPRLLLIIHRRHDPIVKVSNAHKLEKIAAEPKTLIIDDG
jgi:hypothetical protein